jgi:hypothetical protein
VFCFSRRPAASFAALLLSAALFPLHAQSTTATAVTITVTSSANPSVFAAPVTFSVAVAAPASTDAVPTGTVRATLLGPYLVGSCTLDGTGKCSITVPATPSAMATPPWGLAAGSDSVTFSYPGDTKYKSAQATVTQFVSKADTTTTAAASASQPLHLSATVSINEPSAATTQFALPGILSSSEPTGTVRFYDGTTPLGTGILIPSGLFTATATLTVTAAPASLTAVYAGDDNYNGSTSSPVVSGKGSVNLTVTSSVNPSIFAEPVTFSVTVAPATSGGAVATGTVSASLLGLFNLGSTTLDGTGKGSITVPSASMSAIPWGLPAGSDSVTFTYSGDTHYAGAQTALTQTVDKAATATAATVSPSDTSITATVTISEPTVSSIAFAIPAANAGLSNPAGSVQFLNGSTVIGTAPLIPDGHFQSAATLTVSQPFPSTAVLTAVYNGDANYTGSTSPAATIPTLAAVTVGVTSSVNPSTFAEPVTLTIKVAPAVAGSVVPGGTVQASVPGSDILGGATLDSTGSATITVPSPTPTASPALPWGLATGSNVITVTYSGDANFAPGQSTLNQMVTQANTSTAVALSPVPTPTNTSIYVATVSINEASVSKTAFRIPAPGELSSSPTGKVDFYDGATLLGSAPLIPGGMFQSTATFSASPIPASIEAVYHGDTNYNGSNSPTTGLGSGVVTFTLTSSSNPTTYGAKFTILATVAPATSGGPTPTGSVQFFDGSQNLNWTSTLDSSGRGTLPIPVPLATPLVCLLTCPPAANVMVLGAGSHVITVQYSGDANYAPATSMNSVTEQITKVPSTTTLSGVSAVLLPSEGGLVATVGDAQPPTGGPYHFMVMGASGLVDGNPTGTVQFLSGTNQIGTGTLVPNNSGNVTSNAALNTDNITSTSFSATYAGDGNFQGSSSPVPTATSVNLTASPNPSNTGQSVTLTASISVASTAPAPTGRVDFVDGTTHLGSAPISNGVATLTTTFTTAGSHSLTANYSGDANNAPSSSSVYTQVVNTSSTPTDTLKLTLSTNSAVYGQHITLFAQVTGNVSAAPAGTVTFLDGTTVIGTGPLSQNYAYLVVTLAVGTHQISATWPGDSNWPAAQSAAISLTVNLAATVTELTNIGATWTAVVFPLPPGAGTPTGSVQFVDSVTQAVLATVDLTGGVAATTLTSVTDAVQAVYSGDSNFAPSTSRTSPTHRRR